MKSLLDGGASISIGSDVPAGDVNPFPGIAAAISRRSVGQPEVLPPASEVISLEEAVRAYTMGGAARLGKEQIIGSIEVGKRADLIVVDRNPFDLSPEEIAETPVLTTMMNGQITHRAAAGADPEPDALEAFEDFESCEAGPSHWQSGEILRRRAP